MYIHKKKLKLHFGECFELLWEMWSRWSVRAEWGQGRLIHKYTAQKHVTRWEVAHWTPWVGGVEKLVSPGLGWGGSWKITFGVFQEEECEVPGEKERDRAGDTHTHTLHRSHTPNELRTKCRIEWAGRLWSCCGRVATGTPWATASPSPVVPGPEAVRKERVSEATPMLS